MEAWEEDGGRRGSKSVVDDTTQLHRVHAIPTGTEHRMRRPSSTSSSRSRTSLARAKRSRTSREQHPDHNSKGTPPQDLEVLRKRLQEKIDAMEKLTDVQAHAIGTGMEDDGDVSAGKESGENGIGIKDGPRATEPCGHSWYSKKNGMPNEEANKTTGDTSTMEKTRSAVATTTMSESSAPYVVEVDADYDEGDTGPAHTGDYIPYEPLVLERPRVYTDIRPEDIGDLAWNFIDRAYLLIPDNFVSARQMAERNLIQSGLGDKLYVYTYHNAPEDPERARWEAHRKVAIDGMDKNFSRIAVFEHDARCVRISSEMLRQVENELASSLPEKWRLYLLGHDANFCLPMNETSYRLLAKHNFAYIASNSYMDWLARLSPERYAHHPVAKIISWLSPNGVVPHDLAVALCTHVYGIVPPIVCQRGQESTVDGASMTMFVNPFLRSIKLGFDFLLISAYDYLGCWLFP